MIMILDGFKQLNHRSGNGDGLFALNLLHQCKLRLPVYNRHNALPVILSNDRIDFPVSNPLFLIDDLRSLINGSTVDNLAS